MENLKQIVSESFNNWKEISLEEIQALDKKELVKSLKEISPDLEKDLKNGLKNLISNNIQSVNNLGETSSNNQIIIYAMQIYANLCWMKMPIDGVFNKDLVSPDFKKLFTKKQTNLSEKLGLPIEQLKDVKNLSEFLGATLEALIKKMLGKLNSPEWISLKTWEMYKELVLLLAEVDKNLPAWNIYKWNTQLIINNFLTPKENGERLIQAVVDKIINPNEKLLKSQDIEVVKITIKWWLWTLIDIAKTGNDDRLKSYINEFKNIPKIKEYIDKVPEFDKIFDLFISFLKTLDKNELFAQIDNFFSVNTQNLIIISNKKPWEKIDDKVKLEIVNWAWKIVDSLINKERVTVGLNKISEFDFLRKNPLTSQILDIINSSKLSPDDKLRLFKEVSKLVLVTTSPNFKDKTEQSDVIRGALNNLVEMISQLNKEWKLDEQKVIKLVKEIINGWEESSLIEKVKKLRNLKDLSSFLSDNFDTITTLVWWKLKWWDGLEDAIKEFIRKYKLSDNIAKAGWNLIERLEKAFSLNTADMILSIRKTLLEWNIAVDTTFDRRTQTQKAAQDIGGIVIDKISKKWFELIQQKLSSPDNSQKKLTKEDIINTIFSSIWDIFNERELRNKIFENSKKLWANIDNKEQFIQNLVSYFVNNNEFKSIINNISTLILSRLSNSKNISAELDSIKNDINKLISDFSKNYKKDWINGAIRTFNETQIIDQNTKQELIETSLSIVYDYVGKKENILVLLKSFPEISQKLPKWVSDEKATKILGDFIKAIPKNVVWEILQNELHSWININDYKTPEKILELFNKLISHKDVNKDILLQTIIQANLWEVMNSQWWWNEKIHISKETLSSWVDTLYTLLSQTSKNEINTLISSLGLDKIFSGVIDTTLKNIPKETLKRNLLANFDFVNDAINGNIDMNKSLKFSSELYKDIPVGKRLLVVDDLLSGFDTSASWWEKLQINASNSKYISDMVYATLEINDTTQLSNIIWKINPGLQEILSKKEFLWQDNLSLWIWVLKSISKEKFESFLAKNSSDINNFMNSKDEKIIIKLSTELLWDISTTHLRQNLSHENMSQNETALLDMSESIQKSLEKNKSKLENILRVWEKLKNYIDSPEKDFSKSGLTQNEILNFSSDLFDIMSDTLNLELKSIMEKQGISNMADARVKLAEKFEIPTSKWDSKIDMSKISFFDFFMSNPWFSLYWWWAYIFKWQDYTLKNAGIDYFLDTSRKQDFINLTLWYFDLKG